MAGQADAAFVAKVEAALANLDQRFVANHLAQQSLGHRFQQHEGVHDPYLVKIDRLEDKMSEVKRAIDNVQLFAQDNRANINVLWGQLDQSSLAQRTNALEKFIKIVVVPAVLEGHLCTKTCTTSSRIMALHLSRSTSRRSSFLGTMRLKSPIVWELAAMSC